MCIYTFMNTSTFAALADPMRLALIEALRDGEQPVNGLVERVHIQQSGVSRHLGILFRAGLVNVRPEGQQRFYSLRPEPFAELDAWIMQFRAQWEARLDRFGAALERRKALGKKKSKPRSAK
jgi:DNA-binding transcriptional ArsR family regulator